MKHRYLTTLVAIQLASLSMPARAQDATIVSSKHNLSISGPGPFRATTESRICVFCHTPHRARTVAPLWNREDSRETYMIYSSSTFGGVTHQPSGGSKLCLSCHDGSIALGAVVSQQAEIEFDATHRFLNTGPAFIGSSLLDDHPISFHYESSKGGSGVEYRPPSAIVAPVHLDDVGFVQCTSCHDAHNDIHGDFLLTSDLRSDVCLACHDPRDWITSSHGNSAATWTGAGADPWPNAKYATVADNACANCHQSHGAGHLQRLLVFEQEEENCLRCHNGNVAQKDVSSDLTKPFAHDPYATLGLHDPIEDPLVMARHSECQDCHDPHEARAGAAAPPGVPGPLQGIGGLTSSGTPVARINFGFELCYKCHADNHGAQVHVTRQIEQANTRLEFNPANPAFHPVEAPGVNSDVPSLLPPLTTASMIACSDCHQSDNSPAAGGTGAAGPHGSIYSPLLVANYETRDGLPESPQAYALCYRCHSRDSILGDETFKEHNKHVVKERVSCAACHDSHGISSSQGNPTNNSHLINFDISVVQPHPNTGQILFEGQGFRKGQCTLLCHGEKHTQENY